MIGEGEMLKQLITVYQLYGSVIAKKDMHVWDALLQQSHAAFIQQTLLKQVWAPLVLLHSAKLVQQKAPRLLALAVIFALEVQFGGADCGNHRLTRGN
jgi:hypothetical protein